MVLTVQDGAKARPEQHQLQQRQRRLVRFQNPEAEAEHLLPLILAALLFSVNMVAAALSSGGSDGGLHSR